MADIYVLEGPADCGNVFGYWRRGLIPAGRYAVVEDAELANGGYGPCTVDGRLYGSRAEAEAAIGDKIRSRAESRAEGEE